VEQGDQGAAAVLSRRAAAAYGLDVLADSIQDVADNRTRFIVVSPEGPVPDPGSAPAFRTTIAFAVRNEPGTLLVALQVFADRSINLSKLESRPSRAAAWEYIFWADLDVHRDDPACAAALADLASVATMERVLGSHPKSSA
jgi:prephenate dehydratase